ncbi:type II secretion system protein J (GspJ) [Acinetobacter calcoaceticus]|uniref:Type II secretion system protein J n=1 Tax=Acinetobacter calcoaceticus TaxID=471 RepID=A0A4R1XL12_ACICA|nr:type II secretion system protein J (GspJ) [Acinetobacter calcoaceticus]
MSTTKHRMGFTLVELLVAIAIFAVLSALGWKVFDYMAKIKERNGMHEENLEQLQEAYQQIQRDMLQAIPVSANVGGQVKPALELGNKLLSLSKTGVTDPLKQGLAPNERIEYRYNAEEKTLYRLKYAQLNSTRAEQPLSSVLLRNVEDYQVLVLNPNEVNQWPAGVVNLNDHVALKTLPRGIKFNFTIQGVEYEWLLSLLNTDFVTANVRLNRPDLNQQPVFNRFNPALLHMNVVDTNQSEWA